MRERLRQSPLPAVRAPLVSGVSGGSCRTRQRSLTTRNTRVTPRLGVDEGQPRSDARDIEDALHLGKP
jgi:hypothetical protein